MIDKRNTTATEGRSSREIEQDIEHTRQDIDHTLDAIGDRLHPRHLWEGVLELFGSDGESDQWAVETRRSGKKILRKIKRNPVPALLIGAGAAWLFMEDEVDERQREMRKQWDDVPEHSGSFVDARTGQPYDDEYAERHDVALAWHHDYDWADAQYEEEHWTPRAEAALREIEAAANQSERPASERARMIAGKLMSLSGRRRSEIQRALRAQWDGIPSHSGSFVDARTGQPYENTYGENWRQLAAIELFSSSGADEKEEEGWHERASESMQRIRESAADAGTSVKQRLAAIGEHLGSLAEGSRSYASKYGKASRRGARRMARATRRGARQAGRQIGSGYNAAHDYVTDTAEEHPLALGAAVLGLGLAVGAMLPATRREDEAFGDTSDNAKRRAAEAGNEAMQRGQEVVSRAGESAMDEAERQGLMPQQIAERTREAAQNVAAAVKDQTPSAEGLGERIGKVAERGKEAAKEEVNKQRRQAEQTHSG